MIDRGRKQASASRRQSERKGRMAEYVAVWILRLKGYAVLSMRHKTPVGEVDLIARRGSLLIFVEVKLRKNTNTALEAVTPQAQARIARAAAHYLTLHPKLAEHPMRFDVIALAPWRWPVHLKGAFEANR